MAKKKITRFEDIEGWQEAMNLADRLYTLQDSPRFVSDRAFSDQVHRASLSIPGNIAEGYERNTRADFSRFLSYAKGSCGELKTYLMLARRIQFVPAQTGDELIEHAERVARLIGKLRSSLGPQRWR